MTSTGVLLELKKLISNKVGEGNYAYEPVTKGRDLKWDTASKSNSQ